MWLITTMSCLMNSKVEGFLPVVQEEPAASGGDPGPLSLQGAELSQAHDKGFLGSTPHYLSSLQRNVCCTHSSARRMGEASLRGKSHPPSISFLCRRQVPLCPTSSHQGKALSSRRPPAGAHPDLWPGHYPVLFLKKRSLRMFKR